MASSQEGPPQGFSTKLQDVYHPDQSPRRLGITWQDLDIQGSGADAAVHDNVLSQLNPLNKIKRTAGKDQVQTIVDKSFGNVKPGEMLLVLGRPGAGCTSLLKVLANRRQGYAKVSGDVWYGSMNQEQAKQYKGQIVMNTEEELFYPTLTVKQTIDFAVRLKRATNEPRSEADYRQTMSDFLLETMGITHTKDTKVGNEFVRGVSGGERKRVSIIETMATRGSIFCWDNSTRGLDASTALDYARAIRDMTNTLGLASIVTLYQAGNGIYDLFDKVLVLDSGKQIYYGPRDQARPFMEDLGFLCPEGANVADFLTGVTVPTERQIRPGFHNRYPRTAEAVRDQYHASKIHTEMAKQIDFPSLQQTQADTDAFQQATKSDKANSDSPFTVGIMAQIRACIVRQYQILWGDKATFIIKQALTMVQALIAGSLFYNAPDTSAGLFVKGGALFFALLYNSLTAMSEVVDSFTGRPVLAKHKAFSLFHPAAFCLAQIIADIPQLFVQITSFALILYWMVGLGATASQFFIFWVVIFASCMCMTALFRLVGAAFTTFDGASKVSGFIIMAATTYIGYMVPKPDMHPWFVWIYWINPLAYAFEAVMGNEFSRNVIQCVGTNLVPHGDNYTDAAYQSCTGVRGARTGATVLTGNEYLWSLEYSREHLWRNFGIVWAWWALFVGLTVYCTMGWKSSSERGSTLFIPREKVAKTRRLPTDAESNSSDEKVAQSSPPSSREAESVVEKNDLIKNTSIFTWKNLTYTVKTPSGERKLLDNVQGWVKPGTLGALMGSSGAGKTTLLDVLAQRKTEGKIEGSILVDGRPLPVSFQRSAGYCEQLDVHEAYATVREALEFSALLRQSRDTPREEKLKYVDTIIDLLELHDIENSLIGDIGIGLSVEQRKRVTIGVELVAKPSILLFLDEPTSGLDGQSAFNTVRFLRKLADAGQAVLVTIHQPSAQLFAQFDRLLLLARGGQTVYFGDIGENGTTIREYFGRQGVECPPNTNPAEWMIDVCSGHLSRGRNWAEVWLNSAEYKSTTAELNKIISETAEAPPGTHDDGFQFAMPMWEQIKIVTQRANISLWRNTEYINNKFMLHISAALFNGFTFWMIGDSVGDLQLKLFTIFNFIFVAPGVINQLQPLFITRRDIFESRESKSRMYSWHSFVTALIVSEIPYLILCAVLYYVCWYYTIGFPPTASRAGSIFFVMLFYEFVYTGIGQFVAAYAPNAIFASLVNPILIGTLVSFCGALVPYSQITDFWKYWIYYLNPFTYLMGSMLVFGLWGAEVECAEQEFAVFDTPGNATCGEYLGEYMNGTMGGLANLVNPGDTSGCKVCQFKSGSDYLNTLNLTEYSHGWRDAGIVALFAFSSYALVFVLMKLRTKQSKKAS